MTLLVNVYCIGPKVEAQRTQKESLDNINEAKNFDHSDEIYKDSKTHRKQNCCKYCGMGHPQRQQNVWGMQKDQPLQGSVQVNVETATRPETTKEWQVNPLCMTG